ncbi:TcfC E-set like domain-containing protein [Granulosicoccaceae sp. 1_MG-2023]|nr:TcfC E-set like domain-containing protein [Granulosicoccaceae sp. 1_MG-2023]
MSCLLFAAGSPASVSVPVDETTAFRLPGEGSGGRRPAREPAQPETAAESAPASSLSEEEVSQWTVELQQCSSADGQRVPCPADESDESAAQGPALVVEDRAPEGFADPEAQRTSLVDIYFLGRLVSSQRINHDDKTLQIESPQLLLDALTGIRGLDEIGAELRQRLPSNADLVCQPWLKKPGCGRLRPDSVGFIFDEAHLRADFFVAERYLSYKSRYRTKYLPQARTRKTSIIAGKVVTTQLDNDDESFYASATGLFSYGHGNLTVNGDYNSETELQRVRTFSLTHFFPDHEVEAGTFTYSPAGYLANLDVMGVRWNTSLKSRRNVAELFGSELEVFLPRRSIVQLAVGDRVYSGESYEAGNQQLDTSQLPEGTYEVDIRINDPVSGTRVEKRLFTRSSLLPPHERGSYGLMLGAPVDTSSSEKYPQREQQVVFGANYGRRINGRTAWSADLIQLRNDTLLQAELLQLNRYLMWKARALAGESSTFGMGFSLSLKNGPLTSTFSADQYRSSIKFDDEDPDALRNLLSSRFTQVGFGFTRQFEKTLFGLSSSYRNQETYDGTESRSNQWATYIRRPVFQSLGVKGQLEARYQRDDVEEQWLLQLQVSLDRNQWHHEVGTNYGVDADGEASYSTGLSATYSSPDPAADVYWKNTLYTTATDDVTTVGGKVGVENRHFYGKASSEWTDQHDGDNQWRSVAELGVQLGFDTRGTAAGGMAFTGAGAIIDVDGQPRGAGFDIYVNGQRVRAGRVGSRHFVSLKPFQDYSLKLVPTSFVDKGLDRREYQFTLYPGNVERINAHTVPKYELITTLVDLKGNHIADVQVEHAAGPTEVGADGVVQVNVSPGEVIKVRKKDDSECAVIAPYAEGKETYIPARPLVCFADRSI